MIDGSTAGGLVDALSGRTWDPSEIRRRLARRVASFQSLGMKHFDSVLFHSGNTMEFFVDLLAVWCLGGCAIPVDPRLTPFEIETLARTAQPRFSLWNGSPNSEIASRLTPMGIAVCGGIEDTDSEGSSADIHNLTRAVDLDWNALILFTSGTTSQPKGVVHSHRTLQARWTSLRDHLGLDAFQRTLCLLPTHFGHGLICNCLFPWLAGQDLYIAPPFRPDLVMQLGTMIDRHGITFLSSVPAMWRLALKTARPPRSVRLKRVFCGSAPLTESLWTSIREWSGTTDVVNAYGITETASWLAGTTVPNAVPHDGFIGEVWGGAIKISSIGSTATSPDAAPECAPGERGFVWVKTPALMRGYFQRDDLTNQVVRDGWFLTGDIGFLDERGHLYLSGRVREEINKSGMKIHPADIDAVVERCEQTADVCAFAYPDPLHGEDIGIAVVLEPDTPATRRSVFEWAQQHLGRHQLPQRWYVIDEIPRSSRGKINRASLAENCAGLTPSVMKGPSRTPVPDGDKDQLA